VIRRTGFFFMFVSPYQRAASAAARAIYLMFGRAQASARAPVAALIVALGLAQLDADDARAAETGITPHRGIYVLDLLQARSASGIVGARGAVYFEWAETCEGYQVNQHVRMQLAMAEGQPSVAALVFSSSETRDGRTMRFKMRQFADGVISEDLEGVAELMPDGTGVAHFGTPERRDFKLPAGTMFPSTYSQRALAAMAAGKTNFEGFLFDGSSADGAFHVSTFFGAPVERPKPGSKSNETERFWTNRAGYFALEPNDAEPMFEVGSLVNAGGVAAWFDLDYGSFVVRATLSEFEALPEPRC